MELSELVNRYESFRRAILLKAAETSKWDADLYVNIFSFGMEYGVPCDHVREQLLAMAEAGFISLTAYDGQSERRFAEGSDKNSFFFDSGCVRIRLLSAGGELLSLLPKAPIGFAPSSP